MSSCLLPRDSPFGRLRGAKNRRVLPLIKHPADRGRVGLLVAADAAVLCCAFVFLPYELMTNDPFY